MRPAKYRYFAFLVLIVLSLAACARNLNSLSGGGSGGGGTGGGGTGGGGTGNSQTFTIGGKVTGLLGIGMVLENNGGDDLTVAGNGNFTFKTAVNGAYLVTVKTQPNSPTQTCIVTNGSGTATANITTVQVNCSGGGGGFTIGGSVSGLIGSGLVLQDNGSDNFPVTGYGNVSFTFATPLSAGSAYAVTVLTQPSNPTQTCSAVNATGTVNGNVNNVQIICTQPGFTIGGSVVGLVIAAGDTMELQNNAGDDLFVTGDVPFKFPTSVTNGGIYNVSLFLPPSSQPQPCSLFNYTGIASGNVSNVIVDCQHNDWNWITWYVGKTNGANNYAAVTTPLFPKNVPPPPNLNTPGGRDFASTWTDTQGRRWLFGGNGFPYPSPLGAQLPGFLNDLWVFDEGAGGWVPANLPTMLPPLATQWIVDPTQLEATNAGTGAAPGSRWGSSSWTGSGGDLFLFGGQGFGSTFLDPVLLNDVWRCTPAAATVDSNGAGTASCPWVLASGSTAGNTPGIYPASVGGAGTPGGRWAAATATDAAGNVWLFGGQGLDKSGATGLLNDLWMYNIGTNTWTWEGPSTSIAANQTGIYPAAVGGASATTAPGGRQAAVLWVDSAGNVWLFGGFGLDSVPTGASPPPAGAILNDLWELPKAGPMAGQWVWVAGSNTANQAGTYGTQAVATLITPPPAGNFPGARWGAVGWTDSDAPNNLWLFGGWGYGSVTTDPTGFLNDVWEYQASSGNWVWWKGDSAVNQNGAYLTNGIPFVNNVAGGRRGAAIWKQDPNGYFWMFGGEGYDASQGHPPGYLDDLWTYLPFP